MDEWNIWIIFYRWENEIFNIFTLFLFISYLQFYDILREDFEEFLEISIFTFFSNVLIFNLFHFLNEKSSFDLVHELLKNKESIFFQL